MGRSGAHDWVEAPLLLLAHIGCVLLAEKRIPRLRQIHDSNATIAKSMQLRKTALISLIVLVFIALLTALLVYRPTSDITSAGSDAQLRIEAAGGTEKVCAEANQIFARFGASKLKIFSPSELTDYPAVLALGRVDGIFPGNPPFIKVRVGTHINGYIIELMNTNNYPRLEQPRKGVQLIGSCIAVHR